ncbi:MAG: SIS domain-containing protein [Pirellulaceae bacterium]|nr:SIS domain-containing protein [Pirellulaceae bacterium]
MQFAPSSASEYLQQCTHELARIVLSQIDRLVDDIYEAYLKQRFVFIIGNGGSASTASHFCEDLGKGTIPSGQRADSKRIRAISLTDNAPYLLAWGNDEGFECVFEEQLKNLASSGDCLIAISCSGNCPNILRFP